MDDLKNKRVTVMGLGRFGGGIAVCRWLCEQGARVLVTDQEPADNLADSIRQLEGLSVKYRLGRHSESDFTSADLIVASPAVAPTSPYLLAAREAGVPISTEMRLFLKRCPARRVIGVTGTKGKSTTTALLGEMLKTRFTTWVGGNIGKSLLADLPNIQPDDLVLLELSSYMLEQLRDLKWSPHVAVVSMIAVDHVAWHGSVEAYLDAKRNLVRYQSSDDIAVLSAENQGSLDFARYTSARIELYGLKDRKHFKLLIAGRHNQLNAQSAWQAASALGISWDQAQQAVATFKGLPHRLQLVHEAGGVRWINDSIATIPEAAIAACQAYEPGKVVQIVGGDDKKKLPFDAMWEVLGNRAKAVLCIGKTGPQIAQLAKSRPLTAQLKECGDLTTAVGVAKSLAVPGDVVLLSTGCASYDQFVNFEERGILFTHLAEIQ